MVTPLFPFSRYDVSLLRTPRTTSAEKPERESSARPTFELVRTMPIDAWATDHEVVLTAAVPGVHPDNVEVTVLKDTITLRASRPAAVKEPQREPATWYVTELGTGEFRRSVTFPFELDPEQADAQFHHGLLRVRVAKAQHARPTRLAIRTEPGDQSPSLDSGDLIEA